MMCITVAIVMFMLGELHQWYRWKIYHKKYKQEVLKRLYGGDCRHGCSIQTGGHMDDCPACIDEKGL